MAGRVRPVTTGRPPLDAIAGSGAAEAALGLFVIRVALPLSLLALVIWAHIRISLALRRRTDLPADLKASLKSTRHEVQELDETFKRHIGKDTARWARQDQAEAKAAAAALPAPGGPEAVVQKFVPLAVWNDANEPQRQAWINAGMLPADKAS